MVVYDDNRVRSDQYGDGGDEKAPSNPNAVRGAPELGEQQRNREQAMKAIETGNDHAG
jgi:hypothetical protein